jgi:hypothetical protein
VEAAVHLASKALECLDLRRHAATHPRLGVADHISCHPLGGAASLQDAAALATSIAQQLSSGPHQLPIYLYGSASQQGRRLADIRRQLGGPVGFGRCVVTQPPVAGWQSPVASASAAPGARLPATGDVGWQQGVARDAPGTQPS